MSATNLTIQAGIPFSRVFRVVDAKDVWPTLGSLEVRCQLRVGTRPSTRLLSNLHDFMDAAYGTGETANDVVVTLSMTGADTAALADVMPTSSGKADLVLSDAGAVDARAVRVPLTVTVENTTTRLEGDL